MTVWFDDPKQLIRADKTHLFWPTASQTPDERVNASSRFVIYATCALYAIRRDVRIFVLGFTVLMVLYFMHRSELVHASVGRPVQSNDEHTGCTLPTADNPMANVMLHEYADNPNRQPACYYPSVKPLVQRFSDDTFRFDAGRSRTPLPEYQRKAAARQFVTAPVSTIPGDQTAFAEWCYGAKHRPMCRDTPGMCTADARGVQLEAFRGLDVHTGDKR